MTELRKSPKLIAVLEDNAERVRVMRDWLRDRFYMYDHFFTDDPHEFNEHVDRRFADVLAVSLDHDLYDRADLSTELTGMIVAEHLATREPGFPVIIHSTNRRDAASMMELLEARNWHVKQVIPFDDTNWIGLDWYPALKRALRRFAKPMAVEPDASE